MLSLSSNWKRAVSKCEFVHMCMNLFSTAVKYAAIMSASDRTTVSRRRWSNDDVFALDSGQKQEVQRAEIPFYMHLLSSTVMQGIGQRT